MKLQFPRLDRHALKQIKGGGQLHVLPECFDRPCGGFLNIPCAAPCNCRFETPGFPTGVCRLY